MKYEIVDGNVWKTLRSPYVNYNFNKKTGFTATWGVNEDDDPDHCPFGPFILDIEVTTSCAGPGKKLCPFCYKANSPNGKNMSFDTFTKILDNISSGKILQQIAFGADAQCESNPDIWKMMRYARSKNIISNITVADISDETADNLVLHCGAVAVSRYSDKNICYDSVKKLTDRGMKFVNMHFMISEETYDQALETINDIKTDDRLSSLSAIVFLSLKQKGRAEKGFNSLSQDKFNNIVNLCFENNINWGMDSCGAHKTLKAIEHRTDKNKISTMIEPCESSCFSSFCNVDGLFFPCSFCEGVGGWKDGIDIVNCNNFVDDVWMHPRVVEFRNKLLCMGRNCPMFNI